MMQRYVFEVGLSPKEDEPARAILEFDKFGTETLWDSLSLDDAVYVALTNNPHGVFAFDERVYCGFQVSTGTFVIRTDEILSAQPIEVNGVLLSNRPGVKYAPFQSKRGHQDLHLGVGVTSAVVDLHVIGWRAEIDGRLWEARLELNPHLREPKPEIHIEPKN